MLCKQISNNYRISITVHGQTEQIAFHLNNLFRRGKNDCAKHSVCKPKHTSHITDWQPHVCLRAGTHNNSIHLKRHFNFARIEDTCIAGVSCNMHVSANHSYTFRKGHYCNIYESFAIRFLTYRTEHCYYTSKLMPRSEIRGWMVFCFSFSWQLLWEWRRWVSAWVCMCLRRVNVFMYHKCTISIEHRGWNPTMFRSAWSPIGFAAIYMRSNCGNGAF